MALVGLVIALSFAGTTVSAGQQTLYAKFKDIKVVDGDSLHVGGVKVRLFGIDAPELKQHCKDSRGQEWACGQWARGQLAELIKSGVKCQKVDTDRYGRVVARCHAQGQGSAGDVAAQMVSLGAATAFKKYSHDYVGEEKQARAHGVGFWSGQAQNPAEYRRSQKATQKTTSVQKPANAACPIKGNISKSGRLYHLPGMRWYEETSINLKKGERWFCSEAAARAAGWRRAKS